MRFFWVNDTFTELNEWPQTLTGPGFLWVTSGRREFEVLQGDIQAQLQRLAGGALVDLHISDLLNPQLPSQFDYTSWYDLLVFRRLAAGPGTERMFLDEEHGTASTARQALASIDTSPVGFALFDKVLLTVHPADCSVRDFSSTGSVRLAPPRRARSRRSRPCPCPCPCLSTMMAMPTWVRPMPSKACPTRPTPQVGAQPPACPPVRPT